MKKKLWIKFTFAVALIAFFIVSIVVGSDGMGIQKFSDTKLGIDIKGGVSATIYPDVADLSTVDDLQLETAKNILSARLEGQGTFDATLTVDKENKRILMEIPYSSGQDKNPQKVIDDLGKMAYLTFREAAYAQNPDTGANELVMSDTILLDGSDVKSAQAVYQDNKPVVAIDFTASGTVKFADATSRLLGKQIIIYLDDKMISDPVVNSVIADGSAVIEGSFTPEYAMTLASYIQYGALPFGLVAKEINSISPILGESALNVTLKAAILAFLLVVLFMLYRYRLPGLVAAIALVGLVASELFWISAFDASITLPGIAGIILTIGMGVDANVIIYERIKEEIKGGLSIDDSIEAGFKRAFSAIIDANVTTLI
ncbi:MAG: protein translocase subunit SecD, partial [Clostridia bacterium]|nr:protein translocase subunit SecD [Clostridia bacterium]